MDKILQKRQLKWFGHVVRMDERRKPRQIMEVKRKEYEGESDQGKHIWIK